MMQQHPRDDANDDFCFNVATLFNIIPLLNLSACGSGKLAHEAAWADDSCNERVMRRSGKFSQKSH